MAHDHNYERFAPQTPSGAADANGIREIVVGTGGKTLRSFGATAANSEVRDSSTYGVLRLALEAGTYSWQFVWTSQNGQQAGDPAKLAQVLVAIANEEPRRRRLIAGAEAMATAEQVLAELQADIDLNRERFVSLDVTEAGP